LPENGDNSEVITRANELLGDFLDTLRKRLERERTLNDKVKCFRMRTDPISTLLRREKTISSINWSFW
jgi:hypothetical protein